MTWAIIGRPFRYLKSKRHRSLSELQAEVDEVTGGIPILWYDETSEFGRAEVRFLTTRYVYWSQSEKRQGQLALVDELRAHPSDHGTSISLHSLAGGHLVTWQNVKNPSAFFNKLQNATEYRCQEGMV